MAKTTTPAKRATLYAPSGAKVTVNASKAAEYVKRGYTKTAPKPEAPKAPEHDTK